MEFVCAVLCCVAVCCGCVVCVVLCCVLCCCVVLCCVEVAHSPKFPSRKLELNIPPSLFPSGIANDWRNRERVVLDLLSNLKMGKIQRFLVVNL